MSVDMPGLVQTSSNLGLMKLTDSDMTFSTTTRSSMTTQKEWIVRKVRAIVELAGGEVTVDGNYPGWAYNPHSVVKDTVLVCYKELFGKEPPWMLYTPASNAACSLTVSRIWTVYPSAPTWVMFILLMST